MAEPDQISFHYSYIDHALKDQWGAFEALRHEIAVFDPRPLEDFKASREELVNRFRRLNPDSDIASLEALADPQIQYAARPEIQFARAFERRLMTVYVTVAFLSHALSEALINAILAVGLVEKDTHELFPMMERADIKEKWRVGPQAFAASYKLEKGSAIFQTLSELTRRRNVLTHHKISLHVGHERVLSGSEWKDCSADDYLSWIERFFSLPYDLAEYAGSHEGVSIMGSYLDRKPIPVAPAHRRRVNE